MADAPHSSLNPYRARRRALQQRCAEQRQQLAEEVATIGEHFRPIERGVMAVRRFRVIPVLVGLASAVVAGLPVFRSANRALNIFNSVRQILSR